jgi:L-2,4-diaminobutyrate decarboxylase
VEHETMHSARDVDDIELRHAEIRDVFLEISSMLADAINAIPERTHSGATKGELERLLPPAAPAHGGGADALRTLVHEIYLPHIRNYRHPLHYGHQRPAPLAATVIADLAANAFNPTVTMLEAGPISVTIERRVMDWFRQLAGFPAGSRGTLLNGGTESILTALLAARDRGGVGRILGSQDTHYSVARAAHVLGLPSDALVRIPVDPCGRADIPSLQRTATRIHSSGERIMAVVANAGSTANAAFDDLTAMAAVAKNYGAWFHVDGSHGASALLSPRLRPKLQGVEYADSLSWNPHKLLWVASPCSILIVRDPSKLVAALAPGMETASYVIPPAGAHDRGAAPEDDPLRFTIACTRYFSALRLCAAMMVYGTAGLGKRIERAHDLAWDLYKRLDSASDFHVHSEPELNMVCFRHVPIAREMSTGELNLHNQAIRERLAAGTDAYVTGVELGDRYWLRAQIMSPNTTSWANARLLEFVRQAGDECRGALSQRISHAKESAHARDTTSECTTALDIL